MGKSTSRRHREGVQRRDPPPLKRWGTRRMHCGLYVHIPFCQTKCGYCDFYSVPLGKRATAPLVNAVQRELGRRTAATAYPITTIFVGGGTPTLLPPDQLEALLTSLREITARHPVVEFSVEANPATVDDQKASLLTKSGVNRVSMGAQSFFAQELVVLERLHKPDDIPAAVQLLRRHHIAQVNIDLIFGIPGQTLESWALSLRRAVDLAPDHLSCYGLTYEPGTRLTAQRKRGSITPCDENLEAEMLHLTGESLAAAGFEQYEISNYARPGGRCRHNLGYWRNEPYIGVGPSAAGCIGRQRYKNVTDVGAYVRLIGHRGDAVAESETLDNEMMLTEMVMMQLRLVEGLSRASCRERLGIDPVEFFGAVLAKLEGLGLLAATDTHVALTKAGRLVADAVMTELVSVPVRSPPLAPVRHG